MVGLARFARRHAKKRTFNLDGYMEIPSEQVKYFPAVFRATLVRLRMADLL